MQYEPFIVTVESRSISIVDINTATFVLHVPNNNMSCTQVLCDYVGSLALDSTSPPTDSHMDTMGVCSEIGLI